MKSMIMIMMIVMKMVAMIRTKGNVLMLLMQLLLLYLL